MFSEGLKLKPCPINKDEFYLCIEDDEFKECFGYGFHKNLIYFAEGIYPPSFEQVPDCLKLSSEVLGFVKDWSSKNKREEDTDEDDPSFDWI